MNGSRSPKDVEFWTRVNQNTELFERRRRLMDDWAAYLAGESRELEAAPIP